MSKVVSTIFILILLSVIGYFGYNKFLRHRPGRILGEYRGVKIYENGRDYLRSHGRHFAEDGYYFGQKWQCVEYIKRFYYQAFNHRMPEVMGHASSFIDFKLLPNQFNAARCMWQYYQGGDIAPQVDDLLVFANDKYGHVAIITAVGEDFVEVVQQNILGKPREILSMDRNNGFQIFRENGMPASGWLRLPVTD